MGSTIAASPLPAMLDWRRKKKAAAPVRLADLAETPDEEAPILLPAEGEDTPAEEAPAEPTPIIPMEDIEEMPAEDNE